MKRYAIGILALAVIGLLAVSACIGIQKPQSADVQTPYPRQTQSAPDPTPDAASETESTPAPNATSNAEQINTAVPSTPDAQPTAASAAEPTEPSMQTTESPALITAEPVPTEMVKLDSFSFADNDIVPVDLDYDGISETVSIVPDTESGAMKLVIEVENDYEININMDAASLVCAYVTDFCFGDGSAELVVSYMRHDGSYVTSVVGSFSSDTPVSCVSFDGWVETLCESGLRLCRTADVLGMRGISMLHTYSSENGSFIPLEKAWTVYSYGLYATLSAELTAVRFTDEGEEELLLEAGTRLIPTATDFHSYIDFETEQGVTGRILTAYENADTFIYEGVELNSMFDELPTL